jgi:hypothetical protein
MAGFPGKGGLKVEADLPYNINAFKHGLAAIQRRRENTI